MLSVWLSFQLKYSASKENLVLIPDEIHCDFERGAIKFFKLHFPGVRIVGRHFHLSGSIYKKLCEFGLKRPYTGLNSCSKFGLWVSMLISLPFLMPEDIDEVWIEMKTTKPILSGEVDKIKIDQFIKYIEKTWLSENSHFDRSVWNLLKQYSSRINNIL